MRCELRSPRVFEEPIDFFVVYVATDFIASAILPAKRNSARQSPMTASFAKPAAPYTILVSDDDAAIRRSLQLVLNARGYQARGYTSGSALIADPRALSADCIVVDYRMPDIDGLTLLCRLRGKGWRGRAILISAYHDRWLERRAREQGFDEVIPKPFIRGAILDAIARFVSDDVGPGGDPACLC